MLFVILSKIHIAKRKAAANAASELVQRVMELIAEKRAEEARFVNEARRVALRVAAEKAAAEKRAAEHAAEVARWEAETARIKAAREAEERAVQERWAAKDRADRAAAASLGLDLATYRWRRQMAEEAREREAAKRKAEDDAYWDSVHRGANGFMAYGM